jgi:hypothetical protein
MAGDKKSLASFFEDEEESSVKTTNIVKKCCVEDLVALLFKARNDAHISHLLQKDKTLARHNAFSVFYEEILPMVDTLCESYMGLNEITEIKVPESTAIDNPTGYFKTLYAKVEEVKAGSSEGYLLNQFDSINQLIAQTLYRFKNIIT